MSLPLHIDLFSGIGGFALAARRTGFETVQFVEIEPFAQAVLRKNFPGIPIHEDVRTFDATGYAGTIGLLTGGFPCQDISVAGKGAGIEGERSGLWREMFRIICECRPAFILVENVPALRNRGADRVLSDLEGAGYTAGAHVVGADDIGATHRRKRVWIVAYSQEAMRQLSGDTRQWGARFTDYSINALAYSNGSGRGEHSGEQSGREFLPSSQYRSATMADTAGTEQQGHQGGVCGANSGREVDRYAERSASADLARSGNEDVAYTDELYGRRELRQPDMCEGRTRIEHQWSGRNLPAFPPTRNDFRGWATVAEVEPSLMPCVEREVCDVADELSAKLVRRRRNATLKALGNAIVPRNAELIMMWIREQLER